MRYYRRAMSRIARLFLILTLALALPFHAAYGVGMAQCMAFMSASQPIGAAVYPSGHADHGAHGAHAGMVHEHAGHSHGQVGHDSRSTHDNDRSDPHCGTCTACCTSVGISGSAPLIVSADGYVGPDPLSQQRPKSFKPSRLDRPPLAA